MDGLQVAAREGEGGQGFMIRRDVLDGDGGGRYVDVVDGTGGGGDEGGTQWRDGE